MAARHWRGNVTSDDYDPANWLETAVPTSSDAVSFSTNNPCTIDSSSPFYVGQPARWGSLTAVGYSGTLTLVDEMHAFGNTTFVAGMTFTAVANSIFGIYGACALTTAGQTMPAIRVSVGGSLTFLDATTANEYFEIEEPTTVALGAHAFQVNVSQDDYGLFQEEATTWTWSTGGQFIIATTGDFAASFYIDAPASPSFPPLVFDCTLGGSVTIQSDDLDCAGLTLIEGSLGGLAGRTVTVTGDFASTNCDLTAASAWTLNVTGSARADGGTITNCDASGGSYLFAYNATDGGGNVGVIFAQPPSSTRQPQTINAGPVSVAIPVTPSDSTTFGPTQGLWVGVFGSVTVVDLRGQVATFTDVTAGTLIPVQCTMVLATGTTASSLLRLN